jgi:hypothetical protein
MGIVVHTYNPSYGGGIGKRITVMAGSRQKCEALSEK